MKTAALARRGAGLEGSPIMYEPSRNLFSFHIAGFQHHDGALVQGSSRPVTRWSSCPSATTPMTRRPSRSNSVAPCSATFPRTRWARFRPCSFTGMALPSSAACSRSHPSAVLGIRSEPPCSCAMRGRAEFGQPAWPALHFPEEIGCVVLRFVKDAVHDGDAVDDAVDADILPA